MPVTCLVVGCGSRYNRDDVKFFSVPAVLSLYLWIAAIKRDDLTESKLKNKRVCSKHFITGRPAGVEDESHPDWVPLQEIGHKSQTMHRQQDDVERKGRLDKRRKLRAEQADLDVELDSETPNHDNSDTGVVSQTDITMEELTLKFDIEFRFKNNT